MPANAMMMVHRAWTVAMGNANDFRKMAEDMDKIDESIVAVYESKTGMKQEDIISLLDAETWLTAQDALDNGFCDEIEEGKQVAASLKGDFLNVNGVDMDLKRFKNAPKLGFIPKASDETVSEDTTENEAATEEYEEGKISAESDELLENISKDKDELKNKEKIESIKAKLALECEL